MITADGGEKKKQSDSGYIFILEPDMVSERSQE